MATSKLQPKVAQPAAPAAPPTAVDTDAPATPGVQRIASARLFAGAKELQIEHQGALYRLKQTALGKLILTK